MEERAVPATIINILLLSLFLGQQGCVPTVKGGGAQMLYEQHRSPRVTEEVRAKIRTIGVVVSEELPNMSLDRSVSIDRHDRPLTGPASSRPGLKEEDLRPLMNNPILGLPATMLLGALFGGATVYEYVGTLIEETEKPSAEAVKSGEAQVHGALLSEYLIHRLKKQVLAQVTERTDVEATILPKDAGDQTNHREAVTAKGGQPDARLTIVLTSAELRRTLSEIDPPLALQVEARVTLTGPSTASRPHQDSFRYVTGARRLTEWSAEDAKGLREAIDVSLARLAELIVDDLFLTDSKVSGLKPAAPLAERESQVATLRPTFRWERFPRSQDRDELDPRGKRITAVTYEVRLWKVGKQFPEISNLMKAGTGEQRYFDYKYTWGHGCRDTDPGELVYRQQGLGQPEHTLEIPLQPKSRYFWSVRAQFTFDGKRRATEWSAQVIRDPSDRFEGRARSCAHPATFHLIQTP